MKYIAALPVFFLFAGCDTNKPIAANDSVAVPSALEPHPTVSARPTAEVKSVAWTLDCDTKQVWRASYELGTTQNLPANFGAQQQFVVVADTRLKAKGFVSTLERAWRNLSTGVDTLFPSRSQSWKALTARQKQTQLARQRIKFNRIADSIHAVNNHGHYQILLLNNSADTIHLARQDGSLICVMQALTKDKQWRPVQYWQFSWCGNSYFDQLLLPKERVSLLTKLPKRGDYKTKLRYKLAGTDRFYYSNEFEGYINYQEFIEENPCYPLLVGDQSRPDMLLDSLPRSRKSYGMTTTLSQLLRN